ncbi:MAG TPA: fumarylacetoacetate hydrolase family protein [Pseudomonas xinjiangensis]|uniref:Fumarylacetoacetate hydrolase family protein n=2 Tax=root TaxID=1 RepID=A0A7V1BNY8_9GAMM|nr:fumarylacetoacetate hydrolase family protein [Halopseudomonas xinjiangensis]HEC48500.1 fumarylacetoacetate hydrolase family protein [Halopseudomonas xinjiangensis]
MAYQHQYDDGTPVNLPMGKVVCVGRNYAEHARELNNPVPTEPLLFIKPATSVVPLSEDISLSSAQGPIHYETEIALLIGNKLSGDVTAEQAEASIVGIGLALDLTLRELQDQLKAKAHPWERAKAFDGACPMSSFVNPERLSLTNVALRLTINGEVRQQGSSAEMITPMVALLRHIARVFTLLPGDVVITGTPAGVGVLHAGDKLELSIPGVLDQATQVRS